MRRSLVAPLTGSLGVVLVSVLGLAGCSSSGRPVATKPRPVAAASPAPSSTATTQPARMTTVFNCGGGAFQPSTLFVVCGDGTTNITGARWVSWTPAGATGTGTVNLVSGGHTATGTAKLQLGQVDQTPSGPQFSELTVTWTGSSPDGHAVDRFHLAVASS